MTTARDVFQASCCAAIDRYDEAIGNQVPRRDAHPVLLDQLVKAWEKTLLNLARAEYGQRGVPKPRAAPRPRAPRSPEEAARKLREAAS